MDNPLHTSHNISPSTETGSVTRDAIYKRYNENVYPGVDDANAAFQMGYGLVYSQRIFSNGNNTGLSSYATASTIAPVEQIPVSPATIDNSFNARRAAQLSGEAADVVVSDTASSHQFGRNEGVVELHVENAEDMLIEARRRVNEAISPLNSPQDAA